MRDSELRGGQAECRGEWNQLVTEEVGELMVCVAGLVGDGRGELDGRERGDSTVTALEGKILFSSILPFAVKCPFSL